MENFLPRGQGKVVSGADGNIKQIVAYCGGKPILIDVVNGEPKRRDTSEIPYFKIPDAKFHPFYRQIRAVIANGRKTAEKFNTVKKTDWAASLAQCDIAISEGKVIVAHWKTTGKKTGERNRVLTPARDINAAIRMQDHIVESYNSGATGELDQLLAKLYVKRPHQELRRQTLLYARDCMLATLDEAYDRYKQIASLATRQNGPAFKALAEKTTELIFLLKNQWPNPYRLEVEAIKQQLEEIRRFAARKDADPVMIRLFAIKVKLKVLANQAIKVGIKLAEVDPIKTLTEVDRRGLIAEVLAIAELRLGRKEYSLEEILTFAREVIDYGGLKRLPIIIKKRRQTAKSRFAQTSLDLH